jgi:hypothetical protein
VHPHDTRAIMHTSTGQLLCIYYFLPSRLSIHTHFLACGEQPGSTRPMTTCSACAAQQGGCGLSAERHLVTPRWAHFCLPAESVFWHGVKTKFMAPRQAGVFESLLAYAEFLCCMHPRCFRQAVDAGGCSCIRLAPMHLRLHDCGGGDA